MLVNRGKVTAVIDWAQMGYGDWMSDFARLDFWHPERHGNAMIFALRYGLDNDRIAQRKALYWATNALWTVEFADKTNNAGVSAWLKENLHKKLL
jgi:aminoglycoside phosphotransferase (APT) family kinase protein